MKTFKELMTEASVGKSNVYAASVKVVDFLEKSLSKAFHDVDGQKFANNSGTYFGLLFIADDGAAIRVNWEDTTFHSINFWDNYGEETTPTMEITVKGLGPEDRSFAKILPEIAAIIKGENYDDEDEDLDESVKIDEASNTYEWEGQHYNGKPELVWALYQQGKSLDEIKTIAGTSPGHVKQIIAKRQGEMEPTVSKSGKVKAVAGKAETIVPLKATKAADAKLEETEYADPDTIFEELDSYVTLIGKGFMPALMITGQGGIGKSYTVTNVLKQYGSKGEDWVVMKGHCTAPAMYKFLYNHYNQICVFDDCDSIFDTADGMNVLKGALDSGEERELSWMSKGADVVDTFGCETHEEVEQRLAEFSAENNGRDGTPSYFKFEGAVIFISNLNKSVIYKKDRALLSRCTVVDIVLRAKDVIKRIKTVLPTIKIYKALGPKDKRDITDEKIKQEVFDYISSEEFLSHPKMRGKEINFRRF